MKNYIPDINAVCIKWVDSQHFGRLLSEHAICTTNIKQAVDFFMQNIARAVEKLP